MWSTDVFFNVSLNKLLSKQRSRPCENTMAFKWPRMGSGLILLISNMVLDRSSTHQLSANVPKVLMVSVQVAGDLWCCDGHVISWTHVTFPAYVLWDIFCITIKIQLQRCACLVTWFCYQMIAKKGNKIGTPSWPDSYELQPIKFNQQTTARQQRWHTSRVNDMFYINLSAMLPTGTIKLHKPYVVVPQARLSNKPARIIISSKSKSCMHSYRNIYSP